jgi:hypothetical protein
MIRVREVGKDPQGRPRRACSGCGKPAALQVVGQTVVSDRPSSESVDLCGRCIERTNDKLAVWLATNPLPIRKRQRAKK